MTAGSKKIIPALTGLRAVAIVWMVMFHFSPDIPNVLPSLKGFVNVTNSVAYRMDLLFILSGFVIPYAYLSPQQGFTLRSFGHFLRARFIRLYPSYLVSCAVLVMLVILGTHLGLRKDYDQSLKALLAHLALIQAWPYFTWSQLTWGPATWFLSAIWFVYLFIFPCAWLLIGKLRSLWTALFWVFAPMAVRATLAPLALQAALLHTPMSDQFHFVLRASCGFISGSALFALYSNGSAVIKAAQRHLDKTAVLFLVASLLLPVLPSDAARGLGNLLLLVAAPALVAGLTGGSSFTNRLLSTRFLAWLASISYSLYVTHYIAVRFLGIVLPSARFVNSPFLIRHLVSAAYLLVVLLSAIAMHRLVELPCAKALKNLSFTRWSGIFSKGVGFTRPAEAKAITRRAP